MISRVIYFVLIGWWAGLLASIVAYILCATIIGIPLGVMIFNRLPGIIFLAEPGEVCPEGYGHRHVMEELPMLLRIVWFVLLGWELGLLALIGGYLFAVTIIGIPIGIWILNRVPLVMTLRRRYS